jgi:hypothetical protein
MKAKIFLQFGSNKNGLFLWEHTKMRQSSRMIFGSHMRNCDELPTAIVTLLPLVLLLASLENKVFQYGIYR